MYNDVAGITPEDKHIELKDYEIPMKKYKGWDYSIFKAMISPSESVLYGMIIVGLIVFGIFA